MTTDYTYSWRTIQNRVFEYVNTVLGTQKNITGYTEQNYPRTMPVNGEGQYIFKFKIGGGANPIIRQNRTDLTSGAWQMNGVIECRCDSEYTAMLTGGTVFNALPITSGDIDGVSLCYAPEMPDYDWQIFRVVNDDSAGQEQRFCVMTIPVIVAFGNVDRDE